MVYQCLGKKLPLVMSALTEEVLRKVVTIADEIELEELERILKGYGSSNQKNKGHPTL